MQDVNPVAIAFKQGKANLIAGWLQGISDKLKTYAGNDFDDPIYLLELVAAEVRKQQRPAASEAPASGKKPLPGRIDPNSKIPRPVTPPRGSGPVRQAPPPPQYQFTPPLRD